MAAQDQATASQSSVPPQIFNLQEETQIRQKYKDYPTANTPSNITEAQLDLIREQYQIPLQYDLRVPLPQERMYWRLEGGWIGVPTVTLKYGVRFPLHPFISEFLGFMGIGFSQLVPNSYIHLVCFIAHCKEQKIDPALDLFLSFFKLINSKEAGFKVLTRYANRKTWITTPSSNKGWHLSWVFLRGSDTHLLQPWGEPTKASLGFNELEEVREDDLNKLLDNMPTSPWSLHVLADPEWLYDHGLIIFRDSHEEEAIPHPRSHPEQPRTSAFITSTSSDESESPIEPLVRKGKRSHSSDEAQPSSTKARQSEPEPQPSATEPQTSTTEPPKSSATEPPKTVKRPNIKRAAKKPKRVKITTKPTETTSEPSSTPEHEPEPQPSDQQAQPSAEEQPQPSAEEQPLSRPEGRPLIPTPGFRLMKRNVFEMSDKEKQKRMKTKKQKLTKPPSPKTNTTPEPEATRSSDHPSEPQQPAGTEPTFPRHPPKTPTLRPSSSTQPATFWPNDPKHPLPLSAYNHFNFAADDATFKEYSNKELLFAAAIHQGRVS